MRHHHPLHRPVEDATQRLTRRRPPGEGQTKLARNGRLGPNAPTACRSAGVSATGDQTNRPPAGSDITAMRVG